jgi:hypothetical protein
MSNRQRCPRHQTRSCELWDIDRRTVRGRRDAKGREMTGEECRAAR